MDKIRLDTMLAGIIIIVNLWRNVFTQGSGDGAMCTTNAMFEYCLSEQGFDVSQSTDVLCRVDHEEFFSCPIENLQYCEYSSPIYQEDFTKPFSDLISECTGPSQCLSSPCQNGGTCTRFASSEVCICASGFYGDVCQSKYGDGFTTPRICLSSPCQNGGSCVNYGSTEICQCASGFFGSVCQDTYGQFFPQPSGSTSCTYTQCQNGGTCRNYAGMEICQCVFGYYGHNCENAQNGPFPVVTDKPEDGNDKAGGIGIGVIAGIAIGAVVVVLLFAIFLAIVIKSKRRKSASNQPAIPLNNVQSRPLPAPKIPDAPVLSQHVPLSVKSNQYSPDPGGKEAPMRWEEDYIAPMADRNKFQGAIPGETEDGYTMPLPRVAGSAEDGTYEDLEVYTELDPNTMT